MIEIELQEIRTLAGRIVEMIPPSMPEIDFDHFTPLPGEELEDWRDYELLG